MGLLQQTIYKLTIQNIVLTALTKQMCKQGSKQILKSVNLKNIQFETWEEEKIEYLLKGNKNEQ